jgi:hypothetical protein
VIKMNDNKKVEYRGIGTFGLLGVAFIVLRLCNVIDWNWIWVLAPFWLPIAIALVVILIGIIAGLFDNSER